MGYRLQAVPRRLDQESLDGLNSVKAAAHATGGEVYDTGASRNTIERFTQVLDDCRQSYVLSYVPRGVKPDGWHAVTVTLPKLKKYAVRARKGYSGWS